MLFLEQFNEHKGKESGAKEFKMNTRLQASTVTQALKKMKERGLVKVVKAVNVKTKIVYMGTEFQPEREEHGIKMQNSMINLSMECVNTLNFSH